MASNMNRNSTGSVDYVNTGPVVDKESVKQQPDKLSALQLLNDLKTAQEAIFKLFMNAGDYFSAMVAMDTLAPIQKEMAGYRAFLANFANNYDSLARVSVDFDSSESTFLFEHGLGLRSSVAYGRIIFEVGVDGVIIESMRSVDYIDSFYDTDRKILEDFLKCEFTPNQFKD